MEAVKSGVELIVCEEMDAKFDEKEEGLSLEAFLSLFRDTDLIPN
jgi:hypothetical protein